MDTLERLRNACKERTDQETKELKDSLARLRAHLDAYEAVAVRAAEERILSSLLAAIGSEADPSVDEALPKEALIGSLRGLLELLGWEPERAFIPDFEPEPLPAPEPPREPSPEAVRRGSEVLKEVESMKGTFKGQPPQRLAIVLQLMAAEVRSCLEALPTTHDLHWRLSESIKLIGHMRAEAGVTDFIRGLSYSHRSDWDRMATAMKAKLRRFDRDAETPVSSKKNEPRPRQGGKRQALTAPLLQWPELPAIRRALQNGTVLVAGGVEDPNRRASVLAKYGLELEYAPLESESPRQAWNIAERIKAGTIRGVILIEGSLAHKAANVVTDACSAGGVPYAMAGKGGTAAFGEAVKALEERLSKITRP